MILVILHHICVNMLTLNTLAAEIKAGRAAKGLSQSDLGRQANVSRAQIDRIENGRVSDVGFQTLIRILRVLDLDLVLRPYNHSRPTLTELRARD